MYTTEFYTLPADVQSKIITVMNRSQYERDEAESDALQLQMEDAWEADWDDRDEDDDGYYPVCECSECERSRFANDALQLQMEDADEWDEEDDYADSGDWGYTDEDALRDDISDLRISIRAHARKLDILEAQVRALKGDTCTGLVLYDPAYYITEFEGAVFYAGHKL